MLDVKEVWGRVATDPKLQYRIYLAWVLPAVVLFGAWGDPDWGGILGALFVLTVLPLAFHRLVRLLPGPWQPRTIEEWLDRVTWRLGLAEHGDSGPGARIFVGNLIDDPRRFRTYLPRSFELIESDDTSEVWRSDELLAVIRRDRLRVRLCSVEEEAELEGLVEAVRRRPRLG